MPRRKTFRTNSKRAKAVAPPGKVGENLEGETRKDKLDVLLKDFDVEVEARVHEIESDFDQLISEIQKLYHLEMMKIPKSIQTMKMKDFRESGSSVIEAQMMQQHRQVDELIDSIKKRPLHDRKPVTQLEEISEENTDPEAMEPPKRTQGVPKTTSRTTRATRKQGIIHATPLNARNQNMFCETPFQTPAIDPRLPRTPAVRQGGARKKRPDECVFLVSQNGSPIAVDETPIVFDQGSVRALCLPISDSAIHIDQKTIKKLSSINLHHP